VQLSLSSTTFSSRTRSVKLVAGAYERIAGAQANCDDVEIAAELLWLRGRATGGTCSCRPGPHELKTVTTVVCMLQFVRIPRYARA
jgi:hypothetical protein